eukprot:NODE_352_length_10276_cov_0.244178.p5 type:complete len:254 gc:universal NODE_352_length_10276_cov_0.244178:3202-3963(+)
MVVQTEITSRIAFRNSFSSLISCIDDSVGDDKIKHLSSLFDLIKIADKQWILERNFYLVALHQADICFSVLNYEHLNLFISGLSIVEAVVTRCFEFPKSTLDPFYCHYERAILEIINFVEFQNDWSLQSKLLNHLHIFIQKLDIFSIAILPNMRPIFLLFQPDDIQLHKTLRKSSDYVKSVDIFLKIVMHYNQFKHHLNSYLELILPTLADLIVLSQVDLSYYKLFIDLPNFLDVHVNISQVYGDILVTENTQ